MKDLIKILAEIKIIFSKRAPLPQTATKGHDYRLQLHMGTKVQNIFEIMCSAVS